MENEWMDDSAAFSQTREFIQRATLTVHYGYSLAAKCLWLSVSVLHLL